MTGLCKAWNDESVLPFTQSVGNRRGCRRIPHFTPLRRRVYVCDYGNTASETEAHAVATLNFSLWRLMRLFVLWCLLALRYFLLLDHSRCYMD
jgi:hypothetical protein